MNTTRRNILVGGVTAVVIGLSGYSFFRNAPIDITKQSWPEKTKRLLKSLTKNRNITSGSIQLDIAHFIENGAQANFKVTMPGYDPSSIKALHIIASKNPVPLSVSFFFGSASGAIMAQSRLRLATSQPVLALGIMQDGSCFLDSKPTDVHIKGCTP